MTADIGNTIYDVDHLSLTAARVEAIEAIIKWKLVDGHYVWDDAAAALAHILGFDRYIELVHAQRDNPVIARKVEQLSGPHGYTVYKAIMAQTK